MNGLDAETASKMIRLEHQYQIVRTVLNIVAIVLIGFVLYNQTRILNTNHDTINAIAKTSEATRNGDICLEHILIAHINNQPINQQLFKDCSP